MQEKIMYKQIITDIVKLKNKNKVAGLESFFQTGKGGYGEGDKFYGITNPFIREIVKKYKKTVCIDDVKRLIVSEYHEVRLTAVLFLVEMYNKADLTFKKEIVDIYVSNAEYINNWDLVDLSVYKIVGKYCLECGDYSVLYKLSESNHLWSERMSVVANWILVRNGVYNVLLDLAVKFLNHKHDIIHKAVGWILREMGKSSNEGYNLLLNFLEQYSDCMPRTMLRYSIEKLPLELKKKFMEKKFCLVKKL